jgi:hypothetical protein
MKELPWVSKKNVKALTNDTMIKGTYTEQNKELRD